LACLSRFFGFFITSPLPLPLPLSDTLTKRDGHAFFGVSVAFFFIFFLTLPLPLLLPLSDMLQTPKRVSATYLFHYTRQTWRFQRVHCVLSRQTRKRVPYRMRFHVRLHSLPPEHQHAHLGALVVFGRFSIAGHSLPIRPPPTYPFGYVGGGRLLVFHPNPSLQTDTKTRPIWPRFRVCCLLSLPISNVPTCKERAEVPRERVPKRGKVGQSDTSERSWEPGTHRTEGLASARRLRPHGMPMPYFGWTRLGQGPARTHEKQD